MAAFLIRVGGFAEPVRCPEGATLLDALRKGPIDRTIISGCRGGGCGVCRIRVLRGEYRCGRMSRAHVGVEDEAHGLALACQVHPMSDLDVVIEGRLTCTTDKPGS